MGKTFEIIYLGPIFLKCFFFIPIKLFCVFFFLCHFNLILVSFSQASGFRYPRPASVPPSPALSRHSSPHHSEAEDNDEDERYDEELEAEKDRVNIRQPYTMPVKGKVLLGANGSGEEEASEKNWGVLSHMHYNIMLNLTSEKKFCCNH